MTTLDDLIELRVPGVRRRTLLAAFDRVRPECFRHTVTGVTRLDDESIRHLQARFESLPNVLHWRAILRELGKPNTGADFERALHDRLLRIADDVAEIIPSIQRERREHPVLDLSDLSTTPSYDDHRPVVAAGYVASHGEAYGILHLASFDPETGIAMAWEVWKYPGGGRGGTWRERHLEDFDEGWVRDPQQR